jgi:multiple sugar transport system substrate-binding protein
MKKTVAGAACIFIAAVSFFTASCSSKNRTEKSSGPVTIKYELWDSAQLPAYQKCADVFMQKNPDIKIEITQLGWGDYWTGLQTEMVGGSASDVFTDHLAKFKEFANKEQLIDLTSYIKRDNVDASIYLNGLEKLWQTEDGKCYGLPKDWDTIAIVYNIDALKKAGITEAEANNLTWNPADGGTFEKFIAELSIDSSGRNGLDPKFDKNNVAQYGFALNHSDDRGQGQFSSFAVSTGWMYTDGLYNHSYHYDDPRFIATIKWLHRMELKGFEAPYADTNNGANTLLFSGKAATLLDGSWMIGTYVSNGAIPVGFALLPKGPEGRRSMTNGLADSIWAGTKHSEEAWQWVKFLASEEAQKIVGSYGVVFPAIQSGVDAALKTYADKGINVKAFTDEAADPDCTFVYPVLDNATKVTEIMTRAFDKISLGEEEESAALSSANAEVNALFK